MNRATIACAASFCIISTLVAVLALPGRDIYTTFTTDRTANAEGVDASERAFPATTSTPAVTQPQTADTDQKPNADTEATPSSPLFQQDQAQLADIDFAISVREALVERVYARSTPPLSAPNQMKIAEIEDEISDLELERSLILSFWDSKTLVDFDAVDALVERLHRWIRECDDRIEQIHVAYQRTDELSAGDRIDCVLLEGDLAAHEERLERLLRLCGGHPKRKATAQRATVQLITVNATDTRSS